MATTYSKESNRTGDGVPIFKDRARGGFFFVEKPPLQRPGSPMLVKTHCCGYHDMAPTHKQCIAQDAGIAGCLNCGRNQTQPSRQVLAVENPGLYVASDWLCQ